MTWTIANSGGTPITVYPSFGYTRQSVSNRRYQRTTGGTMQTYAMPTSTQSFTVPLSYVSSDDAITITSWWLADLPLVFTDAGSAFDCRFTNRLEPFQQREPGQFSLLNGLIQLRTI